MACVIPGAFTMLWTSIVYPLARAVADYLEWGLLDPTRLAAMMDQLLERREEWNERRRGKSPKCASAQRKQKRS
jgi:hypothetical protein